MNNLHGLKYKVDLKVDNKLLCEYFSSLEKEPTSSHNESIPVDAPVDSDHTGFPDTVTFSEKNDITFSVMYSIKSMFNLTLSRIIARIRAIWFF